MLKNLNDYITFITLIVLVLLTLRFVLVCFFPKEEQKISFIKVARDIKNYQDNIDE